MHALSVLFTRSCLSSFIPAQLLASPAMVSIRHALTALLGAFFTAVKGDVNGCEIAVYVWCCGVKNPICNCNLAADDDGQCDSVSQALCCRADVMCDCDSPPGLGANQRLNGTTVVDI